MSHLLVTGEWRWREYSRACPGPAPRRERFGLRDILLPPGPARDPRLAGQDRRRPEGQGARAARLQDGQDRRFGAGRAAPVRSGTPVVSCARGACLMPGRRFMFPDTVAWPEATGSVLFEWRRI